MKVFIPSQAGMTKEQVWDLFYGLVGRDWFEVATSKIVKKPAFQAEDISDKLCQEIVDADFAILNECLGGEGQMNLHDEMVVDYYRKIVKSLKRSNK